MNLLENQPLFGLPLILGLTRLAAQSHGNHTAKGSTNPDPDCRIGDSGVRSIEHNLPTIKIEGDYERQDGKDQHQYA